MASRKFRFVSPGVFLKEIDKSQLPGQAPGIGPVIIGRTRQGPAMKPYKVRSMEEFERVFGAPMPGNEGEDPWRQGTDILAESYLPYAAEAYLRAGQGITPSSPVTIIRLAGEADPNATTNSDGEPGWKAKSAHGLFFFTTGSGAPGAHNLELGAVFYGASDDFTVKLRGGSVSGSNAAHTAAPGIPALLDSGTGRLNLILSGSKVEKSVNFLPDELRQSFNTNPVATNSRIMSPSAASLASEYWLGESFEDGIQKFKSKITDSEKGAAIVIRLDSEMASFRSVKHSLTAARTPWLISNDAEMNNSTYSPAAMQKLFRLVALNEGADASRNLIIGIEDIRIPRSSDLGPNVFGSFSVVVRKITSVGLEEIERFDNCNLNPISDNYVSKKIGDQYLEWSDDDKRNRRAGTHPNISEYIRIEMNQQVETGGPDNTSAVPFGFLGPVQPKSISAILTASHGIYPGGDHAVGYSASLGNVDPGWAISNVLMSGSSLTASWGRAPLVISGSQTEGYYMGITPFKRTFLSGEATTVSSEINPGYADHVRRLSDINNNTLTTDQDDGVADGGVSEHSFEFSLDEVVLVPAAGSGLANASAITRPEEVEAVYWQSGSKSGAGSAATAEFLFPSGNVGHLQRTDRGALKKSALHLTASDGTAKIFTFHHDDDIDGGRISAFIESADTYKSPALPFSGQRSSFDFASALSHSIGTFMTGAIDVFPPVINDDGTVKLVLRQKAGGTAGNKPVNTSMDVRGTFVEDNHPFLGSRNQIAVGDFSGGTDAVSFSAQLSAGSANADALRPLTEIVKGFHIPLVGGFDGTNIVEANPFNNNVIEGKTAQTSYAFASIERAIDMIKDAETIEHNLAVMPGITNTSLTTKLVRACESRGDSMAIIDLPGVYVPPSEDSCDSFTARIQTTPLKSAKELAARQLNSSYGATYYPWVKIRDSRSSRDVWVPPSVVALGVMANTENKAAVWFAPAGFNRGGLNQGNAGIPVLQASEQLLSRDRDTLYDANINPIASFVSEGMVVFGQKTLKSTQSALDRINVRRLLIYIKKRVSVISSNLLFEQNVRETWNRFINAVVPELEDVKTRFGLSDYKVVLDDTTTTPDLVDRNIMYAKIFLKPARSIEFIAVDFVITTTGAGFADE